MGSHLGYLLCRGGGQYQLNHCPVMCILHVPYRDIILAGIVSDQNHWRAAQLQPWLRKQCLRFVAATFET